MILNPYASVINAYVLLAGQRPGSGSYADHKSYIDANGQAAYVRALEGLVANTSDASLATSVLTGLGLSNVFTAAQAEAYFAGNAGNRVQAALDLAGLLSGYAGEDATLLAAKTSFNEKIASAYTYASNPANTADVAISVTPVGGGTGQTFTLTTSSTDILFGTTGNDSIEGYFKVADDSKNTLNATDTITDGSTTDDDTLIIVTNTDIAATDTGSVQNIETIDVRVDATTSGGNADFALAATDFSGVKTIKLDVVKAVSAVSTATVTAVGKDVTIDASSDFKGVTAEAATASTVATVNIANVGTAGTAATFDNAATKFGDLTVNGAGYLDIDSINDGSLTATAGQLTAVTAAAATVMNLTATAGNITVDDATKVLVANVNATGNVSFAKADAGAVLNITAGGTVAVTGDANMKATTLNISGVGPSSYAGDPVTTLSLEGNGGKLTMTANDDDSSGLAAVNYKGEGDVVLKITATELVAANNDTDASIFYTDNGSGTFTLESSGVGSLDVSKGDLIDVLKLKTANTLSGKVLSVKSGQTVTFNASQVDSSNGGTANDIVVGIDNNKATNTVTLVLDDEDLTSGAVDLNAIEVAQAAVVTIDASRDTTTGGTRNASTITAFESSDVTGGVINIIGGVNGIKTATSMNAGATGTINITGSGKIELQSTDFTAALLDASQATGAVTGTTFDASVKTIKTGSGKDALTLSAAASHTVELGAGDDKLTLVAATYDNQNVVINGGDGTDTLVMQNGTILTSATTGSISISNIEKIDIVAGNGSVGIDGALLNGKSYDVAFTTSGATQVVDVSVLATDTAVDLSSLSGSTSSDTSVAASTFKINAGSNSAAIAITGMVAAKNEITGSSVAGDVLTGGGKVDTFNIATDAALFAADGTMQDTYVGGAADTGTTTAGKDTLKIVATAADFTVVATDNFSKMSGIESITTGANTGAISLTLGASAETAGILTVDLSGESDGTGGHTVNVAAYTVGAALTGSKGVDTITGGAGADTIIGGEGADVLSGGAGNDTFKYASIIDLFAAANANTLVDASIAGGDGIDTIMFDVAPSTTATEVLDATDPWTAVTSVEVLKTSGKSADAIEITLGAAAYTSGITTVDISSDTTATGANVLDMSNMGGAMTIIGSDGVDTITGSASADTITGGKGADVLDGGAGKDTYIFGSSVATNGADKIVWDSDNTSDIFDFKAFFGSGVATAIDVNGVGTSGLGAFTASNNDDTNIANKVVIFRTEDDADANDVALTASEVFGEIDGASDAFALTEGKAIVIAVGKDTDAAAGNNAAVKYIAYAYAIDTTLDGAAGLSVNDVQLIGTFGSSAGGVVTDDITFASTNFAL